MVLVVDVVVGAGQVEEEVAALQEARGGSGASTEVAGVDLDRPLLGVADAALAAGADEETDVVARAAHALDHVAAEEAGPTGDRDAHGEIFGLARETRSQDSRRMGSGTMNATPPIEREPGASRGSSDPGH